MKLPIEFVCGGIKIPNGYLVSEKKNIFLMELIKMSNITKCYLLLSASSSESSLLKLLIPESYLFSPVWSSVALLVVLLAALAPFVLAEAAPFDEAAPPPWVVDNLSLVLESPKLVFYINVGFGSV